MSMSINAFPKPKALAGASLDATPRLKQLSGVLLSSTPRYECTDVRRIAALALSSSWPCGTEHQQGPQAARRLRRAYMAGMAGRQGWSRLILRQPLMIRAQARPVCWNPTALLPASESEIPSGHLDLDLGAQHTSCKALLAG